MGRIASAAIVAESIVNRDIAPNANIAPEKLGLTERYFGVPLSALRRVDTLQPLPATPTGDVLGLDPGDAFTPGTILPHLTSGDVKASTTTRSALAVITLPDWYETGAACRLILRAGMDGAIADTSADLTVMGFLGDGDGGIVGGNLYGGAVLDINDLASNEYAFLLTPTNLVPGGQLFLRMSLAVVDGAGSDPVIARITKVGIRCVCRG